MTECSTNRGNTRIYSWDNDMRIREVYFRQACTHHCWLAQRDVTLVEKQSIISLFSPNPCGNFNTQCSGGYTYSINNSRVCISNIHFRILYSYKTVHTAKCKAKLLTEHTPRCVAGKCTVSDNWHENETGLGRLQMITGPTGTLYWTHAITAFQQPVSYLRLQL